MAAPGPCADGPCCTHSGARQTLDEMDFERGEADAGLEAARGAVRGTRSRFTESLPGPGTNSATGNADRRAGREAAPGATWGLAPAPVSETGGWSSPGGWSCGAAGRAVRGSHVSEPLCALDTAKVVLQAGAGLPPGGPEK